jgi:hypothetical protein
MKCLFPSPYQAYQSALPVLVLNSVQREALSGASLPDKVFAHFGLALLRSMNQTSMSKRNVNFRQNATSCSWTSRMSWHFQFINTNSHHPTNHKKKDPH